MINVVYECIVGDEAFKCNVTVTELMATQTTILTLVYTMLPSSGLFYGGPEVQSAKTLNKTYFLNFSDIPLPVVF